jgi:hypothetical protein
VASKRITTLVQDISLLIHALGLRGSGAFGDGSPVYLVVQLLAPVRNGDAVVARIAPILAMDESAKVPCLVLSAPACSFLAAAQPRLPLPASAQVQVRFGAHNGLKSDIAPCPKSARSGSGPRATRGAAALTQYFDLLSYSRSEFSFGPMRARPQDKLVRRERATQGKATFGHSN